MPSTSLPVTNGNLPEGFCPQTEQQRLNAYAAQMLVTFPFNYVFINTGSTAPTADNRIFPWFRSNVDGTPDKLYSYVNGSWIALHPTPANSPIRQFYLGTEASVDTYDGGEVGAVTSVTGPMWEIDENMSGRLPMGISDDYGYNTTGGSATINLQHNHGVGYITDAESVLFPALDWTLESNISMIGINPSDVSPESATRDNGNVGTTTSLYPVDGDGNQTKSVLNPYRTGYWIKRTGRIFYRV